MEQKPVAIATLTAEERITFGTATDAIRAHDEVARTMVNAVMRGLAEQRAKLLETHRANWEAAEKKYSLDPRKHYELVQSTGEIVEHVCAAHPGFMAVDLGAVLRTMQAGAEETANAPEGEAPKTKH